MKKKNEKSFAMKILTNFVHLKIVEIKWTVIVLVSTAIIMFPAILYFFEITKFYTSTIIAFITAVFTSNIAQAYLLADSTDGEPDYWLILTVIAAYMILIIIIMAMKVERYPF